MIGTNNPFNIRYSRSNKWLGQTGHRKGFCCFSDLKYGIRACAVLLKNYYQFFHLTTISKMIYRFAPPFENDTIAYIDFVAKHTKIPENYVIRSDDQFLRVLIAVSVYEGNPLDRATIYENLLYVNFNYPRYEEEDD